MLDHGVFQIVLRQPFFQRQPAEADESPIYVNLAAHLLGETADHGEFVGAHDAAGHDQPHAGFQWEARGDVVGDGQARGQNGKIALVAERARYL